MEFRSITCRVCGASYAPLFYWEGAKDPDDKPICHHCAEIEYGAITIVIDGPLKPVSFVVEKEVYSRIKKDCCPEGGEHVFSSDSTGMTIACEKCGERK